MISNFYILVEYKMVSIGPYSQSYNYTHMWNKGDLRPSNIKQQFCPQSMMGIINSTSDFSKFNYVIKLARMENILDHSQANFTLFVPSDKALQGINENIFSNMDDATARHIVKSSMLNYRFPSELLENSPATYYITKDPPNRLFITNISGKTYINNNINVIQKDLLASNGIIHVTDKIIYPEIL